MENDITSAVYDSLRESTEALAETKKEYDAVEKKASSGKYSHQELEKNIYPAMSRLRIQMRQDAEQAIRNAQGLVTKYRADNEALNRLDPAQITDDIKLLQSGIQLLPKDIDAILERSRGNRTMTQLAFRYAKEHNIDVAGLRGKYEYGRKEEELAKNLEGTVHIYERWITKPNALAMLDRFFGLQ